MMVGHNYPTRELLREVLETPKLRLVPHIGYVSLFPFMGRIIPAVSYMSSECKDLFLLCYQFDPSLSCLIINLYV